MVLFLYLCVYVHIKNIVLNINIDVKAVVFVVSLACYNELMFEDENKNCMMDSFELFDKTVNVAHFEKPQ